MTVLVITDSHVGSIVRYEHVGQLRKTHKCSVSDETELPVTFPVDMIQQFRTHPPGDFYVGPPPVAPGSGPAGSPAAMRVA